MSLLNSRPVGFPDVSNPSSPTFTYKSLDKDKPRDILASSLAKAAETVADNAGKSEKPEADSPPSPPRISSARSAYQAEMSLNERPAPTPHSSIDDDVLFAIFQVLYDCDAEAVGMTVKQICDVLIARHPEMDKLSTKTSNLVSAKLNAYIKRIEKGEAGLTFNLTRDWADASPKRMVYVYRGLLSPDYYLKVPIRGIAGLRGDAGPAAGVVGAAGSSNGTGEAGKKRKYRKRREESSPLDALALGADAAVAAPHIIKIEAATMDIPLTYTVPQMESRNVPDEYDFDEFDVLYDDEDEEMPEGEAEEVEVEAEAELEAEEEETEKMEQNRKRLCTHRETEMDGTPDRKVSASPAPTLASTTSSVASLDEPQPPVVALKTLQNGSGTTTKLKSVFNRHTLHQQLLQDVPIVMNVSEKWIEDVRQGFLTQEIKCPEDVSLTELERLFDVNI